MSETKGENPLRAEKRRKLNMLREKGIDPFPHNFLRTSTIAPIHKAHDGIATGEQVADTYRVAGRLMTLRSMGKAAFFNIQDQTGVMQIYLRLEELSELARTQFELIDIGDIVGIEGFAFKTKKGELTLHAKDFQILCKTLEPLPEKYHGLTDVELKYRHRHLDLIMAPETRRVFETRSKIIREIRHFLDARGFLEVETPILQPLYGGAAANPFTTHHRALDMKLYLKISPELYLKRLIVGGFEKVYDLNKNFRNEGIDRTHNPEFTMLEWYEAYTDYFDQMKQFEELVAHLAVKITGSAKITYQGKSLDLTPPWRRLSVYDGLREYAGIDPVATSTANLMALAQSFGCDVNEVTPRGVILMEIFGKKVEPHLWEPTFVTDFPIEVSPLTKLHRTNRDLVERFEPMIAHMEIGNSYSELNDPEDQLQRLKAQEEMRVIDHEAHPMDEDFMNAIDVGMPPTGGVGLGVERIVMLLTDQHSIRDIILFPTMRIVK